MNLTEESKTEAQYLWANNEEDLEKYKNFERINEAPEPIKCEYCGKTNYAKGMVFFRLIHWFEPHCDCEESKRAKELEEKKIREEQERRRIEIEKWEQRQKIERLFRDSKMGLRFQTRTFENFKVNTQNKNAYKTAKAFADNFEKAKKEGIGILFIGNYGTGKTHLACSIAIELMNKGIPVIYGTSISLLGKLKETYNGEYGSSEWNLLDLYSNVDLLIIDDLGKERPSEWVLEKLYYIINQRYENLKPIIITSNFNINEELVNRLSVNNNSSTAEAIVSRLNEMCTGVSVQGEDYRRK